MNTFRILSESFGKERPFYNLSLYVATGIYVIRCSLIVFKYRAMILMATFYFLESNYFISLPFIDSFLMISRKKKNYSKSNEVKTNF